MLANTTESGFVTVNPATGEQLERFSFYGPAEMASVLARADLAFQAFRKLSVHQRARLFSSLAATLRKHQARLAKSIRDNGGRLHSHPCVQLRRSESKNRSGLCFAALDEIQLLAYAHRHRIGARNRH